MNRTKYTCGQSGQASGFPDFCRDKAMVQKGSFRCRACGSSSNVAGECCGQQMEQV